MRHKIPTLRSTAVVCAAMVLIALIFAPSLMGQSGASFFVATSGSDNNPGSLGSPWRTIQHAANSVSAGATVYVMGGVYNESVNFPASGTASAPITFQNYSGQTAVIDGTGRQLLHVEPGVERKLDTGSGQYRESKLRHRQRI